MIRNRLVFVLLIMVFQFFPLAQIEAAPASLSKSSQIVKEAADAYWDYLTEEIIYYRQRAGLKVERLPHYSYEASTERIKKVRTILEKLRKANLKEITYDESISYRILEWELENLHSFHRFFFNQIPIAAYWSPIPDTNRFFSQFRFRQPEDIARYLSLVSQYGNLIREMTGVLKKQYDKGIILPKPALKKATDYMQSLAQPADKSFLFVKSGRLAAKTIPMDNAVEFQKKVRQAINSKVNPALQELVAFVKGDYSRKSPEQVGLWQYPGGKQYYKFLLRFWTGMNIEAEEVHKIGLRQVELINKQLDNLRKEIGFKGDLDAFRNFLRNDPRFKAKSPEAIGKRLMKFKKLAEAQLPRFFNHLPKAPCAVKRLNPRLEAIMTYGFYDPPVGGETHGYYYYNASNLEKKNILNSASPSLILHELLPGHHFQVMLLSENEKLPSFRREYFLSAYTEGWAEYAAYLGYEMGIYKDPYHRCGAVMADLFKAVRMVVDTGMNYYRWPRQKAIDYMKQHLLQPEVEILSETLRYSTGIQGQAVAYKLGRLKILEAREKAEKALGDKFDIKAFHDAILNSGTLPLFLLQDHVDRFIRLAKRK
jgi:uncharacterized protein (DUF885 family)